MDGAVVALDLELLGGGVGEEVADLLVVDLDVADVDVVDGVPVLVGLFALEDVHDRPGERNLKIRIDDFFCNQFMAKWSPGNDSDMFGILLHCERLS